MKKEKLIGGIDYYVEDGVVVFTKKYLVERGKCCGNGCRHCPYEPKRKKDNKKLAS